MFDGGGEERDAVSLRSSFSEFVDQNQRRFVRAAQGFRHLHTGNSESVNLSIKMLEDYGLKLKLLTLEFGNLEIQYLR